MGVNYEIQLLPEFVSAKGGSAFGGEGILTLRLYFGGVFFTTKNTRPRIFGGILVLGFNVVPARPSWY